MWSSGDDIILLNGSLLVGKGKVFSTDPTMLCHGALVGTECLSISVSESYTDDLHLPFPSMGASTMGEAVGSIVIWKKTMVKRLVEEPYQGVQNLHEDMPQVDHGSMREDLIGKRVIIWSAQGDKLGMGLVLLVYPYEPINFKELGDGNLGVVVEFIIGHTNFSSSIGNSNLANVNLISWPTKQLTFEDGTPLKIIERNAHVDDNDCIQCEAQEENNNGDDGGHHMEDILNQRVASKRKYKMIIRKPQDKFHVRHSNKCAQEAVQHVATIDCCEKKCCQMADREKIMQLRVEHWGQSHSQRVTRVYDNLTMAWRDEEKGKQLKLTFDGKDICCIAWYTIHGIPKTTFYRYKQQYMEGTTKAMHGNKGIIRKAWDHVEMGKAIIQDFIDNNAERMPHKSRTSFFDGAREPQLVLPTMYKQIDILHEVNITLNELGYKRMSKSTFHRLWHTTFKTVSLSKTSTFSKCDICTSIKLQLECTRNRVERAKYLMKRRMHMLQQMSCRNVYYGWRLYSELHPNKYLCIIHDKMDQQKTSIPRLQPIPKSLGHAMQLPISLTGMITHGHGQNGYGHFSMGLWPGDPNFTVGSLAMCLRNLERKDKHVYGDLLLAEKTSSSRNLFTALTSRVALDYHMEVKNEDNKYTQVQCETIEHSENVASTTFGHLPGENVGCNQVMGSTMPTQLQSEYAQCAQDNSTGSASFKRLPSVLLLQLDNCGSENKNRYVFAYLSLLVARGVFEMVQLGFLMVGHTHEDIDALFSRFSENLRRKCVFTFPHLMRCFNECTSANPAPFLVKEVPNFKDYVDGCLCDKNKRLVGHSKPLQFRFYMQDGVPLMQYKMHPKAIEWLPQEGIELWERDSQNKPKLPQGQPKIVPVFEYIKDNKQILEGLKSYVSFWKTGVDARGQESSYTKWIQPVIEYWENMINFIKTPTMQEPIVCKEFWPRSSIFMEEENHVHDDDRDMMGLEAHDGHYCGPALNKPREAFNPEIDVKKNDFILVRPSDTIYPIWLGTAMSDIDTNRTSTNYMKVKVQYWAPVSQRKGASDAEVYSDCWNKYWRCNKRDPERWEYLNTIVWSWTTKEVLGCRNVAIKIPKSVCLKAKENLKMAENNDDDIVM